MKRLLVLLCGLLLASPALAFDTGTMRTGRSYGFVGDAVTASGITTTANSTTFGGLSLTGKDKGKAIIVPGAGVNGAPLVTTIVTPTTFAAMAGETTSGSTLFAPLGFNCPVATAQSGAGSYVPGDTITLADGGTVHSVCTVQFTQVVGTPTLLTGGTGCTSGTNIILHGTTGTAGGFPLSVLVTASGGAVTAITGVRWAGRYTVNPTNLASEPLTGDSCTGVTVSLTMGIGLARVTTAGLLAAEPTDPVAQSATSGTGTGATFNMKALPNSDGTTSHVWTAAGSATYGTNNSTAMTNLAARTDGPTVHFEPGTYLLNCGTYSMASSVSLKGAGKNRTTFKLFPYCSQSGAVLGWTSQNDVKLSDFGFDASFAYATSRQPPEATYPINNLGSDFFTVEHVLIDNLSNLWAGVQEVGLAAHGIDTPIVRDLYVRVPHPDSTATFGLNIVETNPTTVERMLVDGLQMIGAGSQFCGNGGTVENSSASGWAYGAGFSTTSPPISVCTATRFLNLSAHDSLNVFDTNFTAPDGLELHGNKMYVSGFQAWNNAGAGIRCEADHSVINGAQLWDNDKATVPNQSSGGFETTVDSSQPNGCGGSKIGGVVSLDDGAATQDLGYADINLNGLTYPLIVWGRDNHFYTQAMGAVPTHDGYFDTGNALSDQAGISSTAAFLMVGLGSTAAYTPTRTGVVRVTVSGNISQSVANDGINAFINTSTGTAPANGAAEAGTRCSREYTWITWPAAGAVRPFSISCTTTMTINVASWADLALEARTGGVVSPTNVRVVFEEQ